MKILVLTNLYPPDVIGGYELGCRQVVEALRGNGHDVRVLTSHPRQPAPIESHVRRTLRLTDVWSDYLFRKSAPVVAHLNQARSLRIDASNVHALLDEIELFQPDVIYVWMLAGLGGLGLMAALHHLRIPWVWHLMDDVPLLLCRSAGEIVPAFARQFERRLQGRYIACSRQLVDEIEAGGITLGEDVEILPNWVDGPKREPRADYLLDGTLRIVSAVGQIDSRIDKGLGLLVEAAARLLEQGLTQFHIDIYGQVVDSSTSDLIRRHGLSDRVRLLGPRSQHELSDLYTQYDLFAFPTRPREPFGFAALEAAHRGCVPVISQVCGIAEWLVHGVHCLKVARTPESLSRTFAAVLNGCIGLAPIGRRCASVIERDFSLRAMMPRIEAILRRATESPRTGGGTAAEAYRLAILAERLTQVMLQEPGIV